MSNSPQTEAETTKKELSMMQVTSIHNESVTRRDENLANDNAARKSSSLYDNVVKQFNKAADLMRLDSNIGKILEKTTNEIVVHFPVKMDDGRIEVLTGYRVQHNNALGPFKGGFASTRQ